MWGQGKKMMGVPRPDAWSEAPIGPWRIEPNPLLAVTTYTLCPFKPTDISSYFNVIKQPSGSTLQCTIQCRDISSTARRKTQQDISSQGLATAYSKSGVLRCIGQPKSSVHTPPGCMLTPNHHSTAHFHHDCGATEVSSITAPGSRYFSKLVFL